MTYTVNDVAEWMKSRILEKRALDQAMAAALIKKTFGDEFVYQNQNGNLAIDRNVLNAFKKLTGSNVVWSKSDRMWRLRAARDAPGRGQE